MDCTDSLQAYHMVQVPLYSPLPCQRDENKMYQKRDFTDVNPMLESIIDTINDLKDGLTLKHSLSTKATTDEHGLTT